MKKYKLLLMSICMLTLVACTKEETPDTDVKEDIIIKQDEQEIPPADTGGNKDEAATQLPLLTYFMKDGSIAHFKGEGNEYATFIRRTEFLDENYINVYEDNGGTVMLRTFRVEEDQIVVVKEEGEFYEDYHPSHEELESLPMLYVYLKTPLDIGTEFNSWKVTDIDATVETPYKTFDHAVILEQKTDEGNTSRSYLVEGFGEVKREFIMTEDGGEFTVSSSLEKIE